MDLLNYTKKICKQNNIFPARSKGQNFLINEDVYNKIIETADLKKDDVVLEVGPGLGFLTERLARKVKKVIAVELDDKLVKILKTRMEEQGISNVEVINGDILKFVIGNLKFGNANPNYQLKITNYKVVANLPYNITSVFLRKFLGRENKPKFLTLMLQKEVAERIVAKPGKLSLLAVSVQFYSEVDLVERVGKENFWPEPEVDSAIIKLEMRNAECGINADDEKKFFQLVKFGFSARRKMLKNNLAGGYRISSAEAGNRLKLAGFSENIRAQELSVEDWVKLLGIFK